MKKIVAAVGEVVDVDDACGFHSGLYNFSDLKCYDPLTKDFGIGAFDFRCFFFISHMCLVKSFHVLG